jgi:hypothetical protein
MSCKIRCRDSSPFAGPLALLVATVVLAACESGGAAGGFSTSDSEENVCPVECRRDLPDLAALRAYLLTREKRGTL